MVEYVIGLDGGGTKTDVALLCVDGTLLRQKRLGPLNPVADGASPSRVVEELIRIHQEAGGRCAAISAACAGAGAAEPAGLLRGALEGAGLCCPVFIRGDHENALWTAFGQDDGIVLAAGTGSVCVGRANGKTARSGGRGPVFDDGGSAYFIGREMLAAVARAMDGRGEETALTTPVFALTGKYDMDTLAAYYCAPGRNRGEIAALAPLISPAAASGDGVALAIVEKAAAELAAMAKAVLCALGCGCLPLAMTGSVLVNNRGLRGKVASLVNEAYPLASCRLCAKNAAVGAAEYGWVALREGFPC